MSIRVAHSHSMSPVEAVSSLHAALHGTEPYGVMFFASSRYALDALGAELKARFQGPILGCTTSGQIGPDGYQPHGIVATAFDLEAEWRSGVGRALGVQTGKKP